MFKITKDKTSHKTSNHRGGMMRIIFLGTGGGRHNLVKQKRWTGGFRIEDGRRAIHVDPGPGALVHLVEVGISPLKTDGVVVTHAHIDHFSDLQVMTEAISQATEVKRGFALVTEEIIQINALDKYHIDLLNEVLTFPYNGSLPFPCKEWNIFSFPVQHGKTQAYGFILEKDGKRVGYTSDTAFFNALPNFLKHCDALILNMTRITTNDCFAHLSLQDIPKILDVAKPKKTILTHLGMEAQEYGEERILRALKDYGDVVVAEDGGVVHV